MSKRNHSATQAPLAPVGPKRACVKCGLDKSPGRLPAVWLDENGLCVYCAPVSKHTKCALGHRGCEFSNVCRWNLESDFDGHWRAGLLRRRFCAAHDRIRKDKLGESGRGIEPAEVAA